MLKFYISCRPIYYKNEVISPNDQLHKGFKGIDLKSLCMVEDRTQDGRMLYEIKIGENSSYTDQQCSDYKDIILEGLQVFGVHLKTVTSAKALAEQISGNQYTISGDSIVPPALTR
jgi:hypothetical protein